jgi:5-formyltetrahydrofolate cyclo-ligase
MIGRSSEHPTERSGPAGIDPGADDGSRRPGAGATGRPSPGASKAVWRRWARAVRATSDLSGASAAVRAGLVPWLADRPPTTVLVYLATAAELEVASIATHPDLVAHRFVTTRTPSLGPLTIHSLDGPLERHRFGFDQPLVDAPAVAAAELGVVLVPGLAFTADGRRLGQGGGYYDRLLGGSGAVAVGIAPAAVVVDDVPTEPHDAPMAWLATEDGVRRCGDRPIASQPR